jgi:WD40 repeat protein
MRTTSALLTGLALTLSAAAARQSARPPGLPTVVATAAHPAAILRGLAAPFWAVAAAGDGNTLLAAAEDGTVAGWTKDAAIGVRSGPGPEELLSGHQGPVLVIAAAGGTTASGGADGKVIAWDLTAGKPFRALDAGGPVRALAVSCDGKTLACTEGAAVQLWSVESGSRKAKLEGGNWLLAIAFSPDGKSVAAAGYDGRITIWEAATGKKRFEFAGSPSPAKGQTTAAPAAVISAITFSPDGSLVALGGSDGAIHLFQADDGKLLRSLAGHTATVTGLAFHPGGELLASCSKDRTVRLWNPATGQLAKTLEGHTAWVQGVTFFARGTHLASASVDRTIRVWDLRDPAKR